MALHNPVLEAAARIHHALKRADYCDIMFARHWCANHKEQALAAVEIAASQIDYLRAHNLLELPAGTFNWQPIEAAPKPRNIDEAQRILIVNERGAMEAMNWCEQAELLLARLGYPKPVFYLATDIPLPEVE